MNENEIKKAADLIKQLAELTDTDHELIVDALIGTCFSEEDSDEILEQYID